jgi:hypothetical protein
MVENSKDVCGYSTHVDYIARFLLELKQTYFSGDENSLFVEVRRKINYSLEMLNNRTSLFSVEPA